MEGGRRLERFETAEKLFFDTRPKDEGMIGSGGVMIKTASGLGPRKEAATTIIDSDSDGEQGAQKEHLQNLRKMVQKKSQGYHVTTRRKLYNEGNLMKPLSPSFMKRTKGRENTKLMETKGSSDRIGLLSGAGITKKGTRIYASNPALGNYRKVTAAMGHRHGIKNKSMPDRINMVTNIVGGLDLQAKNLPKLTHKSPKKEVVENEEEPEYPEYRPGGKLRDVDYTEYSYEADEEDFYDADEEAEEEAAGVKGDGKSEFSTLISSSAAKAELEADWLLEETLKEEMRQFERKSNRLKIKRSMIQILV